MWFILYDLFLHITRSFSSLITVKKKIYIRIYTSIGLGVFEALVNERRCRRTTISHSSLKSDGGWNFRYEGQVSRITKTCQNVPELSGFPGHLRQRSWGIIRVAKGTWHLISVSLITSSVQCHRPSSCCRGRKKNKWPPICTNVKKMSFFAVLLVQSVSHPFGEVSPPPFTVKPTRCSF